MNRRRCISGIAASIVIPKLAGEAAKGATKAPCTMPRDFVGLSYESTQLYNPQFFSAANASLVAAFRDMTPAGVLRLGGNLSDYSRWMSEAGDFLTPQAAAAIDHGKSYWEWKLTDQAVRGHRDGAITPEALRNLKGFLDACGWKAVYGLNFGSGSIARARDEAANVSRILGNRLLALQFGNEVDFYGGNPFFRSKDYALPAYIAEFKAFAAAVREAAPGAAIAGPDTAVNMEWVRALHDALGRELAFLSSHYYAMGPASDPAMNADHLLSAQQRLVEQRATFDALTKGGGISFRVTEANSCFGGGKPGVSDGPVSALWGADYLLQMAAVGYAGVNLHGGGDGLYTPLETVTGAVIKRPLYYGMQFANLFAGSSVMAFAPSRGVSGYIGHRGKTVTIAICNKSLEGVPSSLPARPSGRPRQVLLLGAPGMAPLIIVPNIPSTIPPRSAIAAIW